MGCPWLLGEFFPLFLRAAGAGEVQAWPFWLSENNFGCDHHQFCRSFNSTQKSTFPSIKCFSSRHEISSSYEISSRRDLHQESSSKYQHSVTHTSKSKMVQVERTIKVEKRNSYFNHSVYSNFCLPPSPSNTSDIALAEFPYGDTSFQIALNGELRLLSL